MNLPLCVKPECLPPVTRCVSLLLPAHHNNDHHHHGDDDHDFDDDDHDVDYSYDDDGDGIRWCPLPSRWR